MLKKLTALVVLGFAASLCLVTGASAPVAADTYGPQVPTETHIKVLVAENGKSIRVEFWASANGDKKPTGTLKIQIRRGGGQAMGAQNAPAVYTTTVRYNGKHVVVEGPELNPGQYVVSAEFTPDNPALFLPSDKSVRVKVKKDVKGSNTGDDTGSLGGLPDAGGPDLVWLLLGLGLVGAGTGTVVYARRRQTPAATA